METLRKMAAYCSVAERCTQDVRKKIGQTGLPTESSDHIIKRLQEEKFIDESRYAHFFTNDKIRFNKWGRLKIAYELQKKGIPSSIQEEALSTINEEEYRLILLDLLNSKRQTIKEKKKRDRFNKLLRFATSRGFETHLAIACLQTLGEYEKGETDANDLG